MFIFHRRPWRRRHQSKTERTVKFISYRMRLNVVRRLLAGLGTKKRNGRRSGNLPYHSAPSMVPSNSIRFISTSEMNASERVDWPRGRAGLYYFKMSCIFSMISSLSFSYIFKSEYHIMISFFDLFELEVGKSLEKQ